jgi:acetyl-CoA carboxylase biotin carboxyl carrier protein
MSMKIDYEEIARLVSFLEEKNLTNFELEVEGFKIKISRGVAAPPAPEKTTVPATSAQPPANTPAGLVSQPPESSNNVQYISSPMVGIFYRAPGPTSPPFVEIGEQVSKSQTLCIIEAMKLMNEIESDVEGVITEIFAENGKPVEYGQRLFAIQSVS